MIIEYEAWDDGKLLVNKKFTEVLRHNNITTADALWRLESDVVKSVLKERGTSRAMLKPLSEKDSEITTFIKRYTPIPWNKRLEAVVSLKKYDFDAYHEWNAIIEFHKHDLKTMEPIAVGSPNGRDSALLTLGITDYQRAAELFNHFSPKDKLRKRALIKKMAIYAGRMHKLNMAHQDFYLVHMFVKASEDDTIYLIDLQRTIMGGKLRRRWIVKDLGQLLFSGLHCFSKQEIIFFWKNYCNVSGAKVRDIRLVRAIVNKAEWIRRRLDRKKNKKGQK
jgi:hypothetical protein